MRVNQNISFLHKPCTNVSPNEINGIKSRLFTFLLNNKDKAVGIAANQLNINKRAFAINVDNKIEIFINPVIELSGDVVDNTEGCLSIPNKQFNVKRRMNVSIKADNIFKSKGYRGWYAYVIQHEMDHINGILISDKGEDQ